MEVHGPLFVVVENDATNLSAECRFVDVLDHSLVLSAASCNSSARSLASHRTPPPLDVHDPLWQPEELSKNAGTPARLRGGPAFGHVFAGARLPVQSFPNLGIAISAVLQFLESADGPSVLSFR